jgi:diacylglycerol O-acyltransferase
VLSDGATVKDPHEVTEAMIADFLEIRRAAGISKRLTDLPEAMAPA